jgi:hypothetical protein
LFWSFCYLAFRCALRASSLRASSSGPMPPRGVRRRARARRLRGCEAVPLAYGRCPKRLTMRVAPTFSDQRGPSRLKFDHAQTQL